MTAKKLPSARPWRKDLTVKRWQGLLASGLTMQLYVRRHGFYPSEFIASVIHHLPGEFEQHRASLGPIGEGNCQHCGRHFWKNRSYQKFCSYNCNSRFRMANTPGAVEANRQKMRDFRAKKRKENEAKRALTSEDGPQNPPG